MTAKKSPKAKATKTAKTVKLPKAVKAVKVAKTTKSSKSSLLKKIKNLKPWQKAASGVGVLVVVLAGLTLASVNNPASAATSTGPSPSDAVATPYGSIGKWMLQSGGSISNYGGQQYQGKTLYEVVNAIIVDPTSTSASASITKLNNDMSAAGFGSQFGHSTGFSGLINGTTYSQQPTAFFSAFSDNAFYVQNNHGRIFGPAVATTGGYVYSGALSTETPSIYGHSYVSSNTARNALAKDLVSAGQKQLTSINMSNTYNTTTTTTGDHDGNAVVIVLK